MRTRALALVVLLAGVVAPAGRATPAPERAGVAPRFTTRSVTGRPPVLDTLLARGPVVLDFWATWCKPCLEELPGLQRLHERFGARGLTVIGVSVDAPRNFAKVRPFAARLGLGFPIVIDEDQRLRQLYQVLAMPTTILIAPDGRVAAVRLGYRPGEGEALEHQVAALLAPAAPDSAAADSTAATGH